MQHNNIAKKIRNNIRSDVVVLHSSDILGNIIYTISTIVIYASLFFLFSFKQDPRDFNKLQRGTIIISTFIIFVICIVVLLFI